MMLKSQPSTAMRNLGWLGPTDRYWSWIQEHLLPSDLSTIPSIKSSDALDWMRDSGPSGMLLIGLENRLDNNVRFVKQLCEAGASPATPEKSKSKRKAATLSIDSTTTSSWCAILGESWTGHRRTFPLPDSMAAFYWYELFDRLMPWLSMEPTDHRLSRTDRWLELSNRISLSGEKQTRALVLAENSTTFSMWSDVLRSMRIDSVGANLSDWSFRYEPDCVVLDLDESPQQATNYASEAGTDPDRVPELVRRIRHRYPLAMITVADSFPRWHRWRDWSECGADVLIPKPFSAVGLPWCLDRWLTR